MIDLLPDLTGRPDWVVIVVLALLVAGTIGVKWIGRKALDGDGQGEEDEPGTERPAPLPSAHQASFGSDVQTTLVLTKALDLLASEAVESQGARAEADRLRAELVACSEARAKAEAECERVALDLRAAQADLERCNEECLQIARRALERGGEPQ